MSARLWRFIRRHVPDRADAEDILQEVFYELILAYRLAQPIEQAGAWMLRIARNRITDWFRKKRPDPMPADESGLTLADLLPSPDAGPDAAYARRILADELLDALGELSDAQHTVFLAHEIEGRSFKDISRETGIAVNALISRKHQAVVYLRRRLESIYNDFLMDKEMISRRVAFVVKILLFLGIAVAGFGWAVWGLWNWLMPALFGLPAISFWQAVGLLGLSWILFRGGFLGWGRGMGRHRMRQRWQQMTPEERDRFRKGLMARCGGEPPAQSMP